MATAITKPDFTTIWASGGSKVSPDTSKISSGWGQEMLPFQYENWIQNRQDQGIAYLLQAGVSEWDSQSQYIFKKSVVQKDGALYTAIQDSQGKDPLVYNEYWAPLSPFLGLRTQGTLSSAAQWVDIPALKTDLPSFDSFLNVQALALQSQTKYLREKSLTPFDRGAVGNGTDNNLDTQAFTTLLDEDKSFSFGDGSFVVRPAGVPYPEFNKRGSIIQGPGVYLAKPGTYYTNTPGQEDNYTLANVTGNGSILFGYTFDGNGQATVAPYNPTGPNVQFFPALLNGAESQKAIGLSLKNNGGHAIEANNGTRKIIALSDGSGHNGFAMNSVTGGIMTGLTSEGSTDSGFVAAGSSGSVFNGLVSRNNVLNGGGFDLAGGDDNIISSANFTGGQSYGLWVLRGYNTNQPVRRLLVNGLLSTDNCRFPLDEQAELMFGNHGETTAQGEDLAITGCFAIPKDTPTGGGYNSGIWLHKGWKRVTIHGVAFSGSLSRQDPRSQAIKLNGSEDTNTSHCVSLIKEAEIYATAPAIGFWSYAYNINMRIAPDSKVPTQMESSDAVWPYHITRTLPKSGMHLFDVLYTGGFCHDIIEITLSQEGDSGARKQTIVARGAGGENTVVLASPSESWGTAPPTITVTPLPGKLEVYAQTNSGLPIDNALCAFDIRIISPYDSVSRFKAIFE